MVKTDDLLLTIGDTTIAGWEAIRVTRGIERCPSDFDVAMTESPDNILVAPGQPCEVRLGDDLVLTGYVDRRMPSISARQHVVRVSGRSKCQDLVDCSVVPSILPFLVVRTSSLLSMARDLAKPFDIGVTSLTGDDVPLIGAPGQPIQFNVLLTETPWEIIERMARYAGVLLYDDTDGNLLLANVATSQMSSGFALGGNVQAASAMESMDGRYSEYHPALLATDPFASFDPDGRLFHGSSNPFGVITDDHVPRFRPLYIVSEQNQYGQYIAEKRALWECNRRFGRSHALRLTCDTWRDTEGRLWQPNATAPLSLPALGIMPKEEWVIAEVAFSRDPSRGTTADLVLMPKPAFAVEPIPLQFTNWQQAENLARGGAKPP